MRLTGLGALLVAGLALLWFGPALRGEAFTTVPTHQTAVYPWHGVLPLNGDRYAQSDQADLNAPWESLEHQALGQGTVPLWNPYSFGGQPLLANGSSGVLYPPRLALSAVTGPTTTHTWLSLLHVVGAGLFMYLLLLDLGVGVEAALLGAVAWMFGTYTLDWIQLEVVAPVFCWLPAGVLCVRRAIAGAGVEGGPRGVAAVEHGPRGVAGAESGPDVAGGDSRAHGGAGVESGGRAVGGSWRWTGGCSLVVGLLLLGTHLPYAAVTAMVFLGYGAALALFGDRETATMDAAQRMTRLLRVAIAGGVGIALAAVTLVPTAYLLSAADRASIGYSTMVKLFLLQPADLRYALMPPPHGTGASAEAHIHQAAFVGTLVFIAAVIGFFLRRRGTGLGRACVVGSVLVAVGGPATWFAYHFVPAMPAFHPYSRLLYITDFGTVVLGAIGFAWVIGHFRRRAAVVVAAIVIGVTALQLGLHGRGENPPFAATRSVYPATPLLRALQADGGSWRMLPLRLDAAHAPMLYAGESVVFRLTSAGGYDSVVPVRTVALWSVTQGAAPARVVGAKGPLDDVPTWELATTRFDLLPRLGVDRIVSAPEVLAAPGPVLALERAGWKRIYAGRDGVIWSWTGPPVGPRVVGHVERVSGDLAALTAFTSPAFDAGSTVVLEHGSAVAPGRGGGTVTVHRGINSVDARVDSPGGYLVVPDSWDAGWQATVNGRSAPVLRANYDQQAVAVPPGDVRVTLRYRPPGLRLGGLLSLLGVLAVAVLLVAPWGRSRRRSPGRSRRRSPGRTRGRHRMSPDTAIGTAEQPEVLTSSGAGAPARTASPSS